ncbi:DUF6346 domain-containing protein [Actinoalloteichus hymeniacidonis]|uniref:Uncharacterized protein n=1 Tax=Actinoalloteichus hymeniacidonis TaxID=340345 RepID=A0AAC9MVE4_9PSEU|nr:DUF6346 domain-containing protein [Actinoalloteichus hymeniacidonis]AOS61108.1 hypothetical protein TL08_01335 [Actinoalloteichus hymeniacidonis]MBB5910891.1 hypothetical protein [Actinoalloteichus hymeniacidonis]
MEIFGRLLRLVLGLLLAAGILLASLTIVFAFDRSVGEGNATATVQSCERSGPITRFGFGYRTSCVIDVRADDGRTWSGVRRDDTFAVEDVGDSVRIVGLTRPRSPSESLWLVQKENTGISGWLWWPLAFLGIIGGGLAALMVVVHSLLGLSSPEERAKRKAEAKATAEANRAEREAKDQRFKEHIAQVNAANAERRRQRRAAKEAARRGHS